MDAKAWIALIALAISIGGGGTWLHQNFLTIAAAADLFSQQQADAERDRLELELDLKQHELEWLLSLDEPTVADEKKIAYLERAIDRLEQRLMELD